MTIISTIIAIAGLLAGFFFGRRFTTTKPPASQPTSHPQRETYVDRIDEITRAAEDPFPISGTDSDLADWINRNVGGGQ